MKLKYRNTSEGHEVLAIDEAGVVVGWGIDEYTPLRAATNCLRDAEERRITGPCHYISMWRSDPQKYVTLPGATRQAAERRAMAE